MIGDQDPVLTEHLGRVKTNPIGYAVTSADAGQSVEVRLSSDDSSPLGGLETLGNESHGSLERLESLRLFRGILLAVVASVAILGVIVGLVGGWLYFFQVVLTH